MSVKYNTPFGVTSVVEKGSSMTETPFVFDDSYKGPHTLWSAYKIQDAILSRKGLDVVEHDPNNIALFGLEDSKITLDDARSQDPSVLWSSLRSKQAFDNFSSNHIALVPENTNAAIFSASGEPTGSLYPIGDSSKNPNAIWSSVKVSNAIKSSKGMMMGSENDSGKIAVFDETTGQVVSSTTAPIQSAETAAIVRKSTINKIPSVVAPMNNLATFNSDGSVKDSGVYIDSTKKLSNVVWPSTRVQSEINIMSGTIESKIKEASSKAANAQILNVSALVIPSTSGKMMLQPSALNGNMAVYNQTGQVVDSSMKLNDASSTTKDVWSALRTKVALDSLASTSLTTPYTVATASLADIQKAIADKNAVAIKKMPKLSPSTTVNVAVFDSNGGLVDGGFVLDDTVAKTSNVWSALKIRDYLTASDTDVQSKIASLKSATTTLEQLLSGYMNLVPTAPSGDIAIFNNAGQVVDSKTLTKPASYINAALDLKVGGTGVSNKIASWNTSTTLMSSALDLKDGAYTTTNLLSAQGISDAVAVVMNPYMRVDSSKIYAVYKVENFIHPGPYWKSFNAANWKGAPLTLLESNFTKIPDRKAFFRAMYFGAATSAVNCRLFVSGESNKRQDFLIPANQIIPHYWSNIYSAAKMYDSIGFVVDPGPATIIFGTLCIIEL